MKRSICFLILASLCLGQSCGDLISPYTGQGIPSGVYSGTVNSVTTMTGISAEGDAPETETMEGSFAITKEFVSGVEATVEGWPLLVGAVKPMQFGGATGVYTARQITTGQGLTVVIWNVAVIIPLPEEEAYLTGSCTDTYRNLGNGRISYTSVVKAASQPLESVGGYVICETTIEGTLSR